MPLRKDQPRDVSIAEWLGWRYVRENEFLGFGHKAGWVVPQPGGCFIIMPKLNFRYDWRQIMAVVEKIEADTNEQGNHPYVTIDTHFVRIDDQEYRIPEGKPKQDIVWAAVSDYCLKKITHAANPITGTDQEG